MTNVGDSFCNSYVYYLVGLHISDIGKVVSSLLQSLSSLLLLFKMPSASWDAICSSHHCRVNLRHLVVNLGLQLIEVVWAGAVHLGFEIAPEKGLLFYLYLQKFHMDFSLSTVIFATAKFHKRKFFLRHPVGTNEKIIVKKFNFYFWINILVSQICSTPINLWITLSLDRSDAAEFRGEIWHNRRPENKTKDKNKCKYN